MRLIRSFLLIAMLALAVTAPARAIGLPGCSDESEDVYLIDDESIGRGRIALPATTPTHVVAFAHGYGHTSFSWIEHMKRTAEAGAIAFTLDYPGAPVSTDDDGNESTRGWQVSAGADATNALTEALMVACGVDDSILYGVSMGGNTSGLALAAGETVGETTEPLYDHWIAVEPAANVLETYLEATALESTSEFIARAKADIEAEMGGTFTEAPEAFLERTVVLRAADIAASGVQGVVVVHALDDGLVPYDQGRELATVLRLNGVPTDFYNVVQRETDGTPEGSDNTTISENVARPLLGGLGQSYTEPLAGHGTESSQTNVVVQTGLDVLFEILRGASLPADHEFVVDGAAKSTTQLL